MADQKNQDAIGEEIGRKITAKDLGFSKSAILDVVMADKENAHFLYRVVGLATGTKFYKTVQGGEVIEGYGLLGTFEATTKDGVVAVGSVLYLPGYVQDAIVAAVDTGLGNVQVAVDVYAKFDADAATSYVFTVRNLLPAAQEAIDAVKQLVAGNNAGKLPALPSR